MPQFSSYRVKLDNLTNKKGPKQSHMRTRCWEFTGAAGRTYGQMWIDGKYELTHRVAYCFGRGLELDDIKNIVIRHRCDNQRCCRPSHLRKGSQADNISDMMKRKRHAFHVGTGYIPHEKGVKHPNASFTKKDLKQIKRLLKSKTPKQVAEIYGVHFSTIYRLKTGVTYV